MDSVYIKEPEDGLIRYGPEVIEFIRKEYNLDNKQNRETAIAIINDWIRQQEHFVKKDFSKGYIERCLLTCKGSLERTKRQIDRMCTMRTLLPKYFEIINFREGEMAEFLEKGEFALLPKLTDDYYRVALIRVKPNRVIRSAKEFTLLLKFVAIVAEYIKSHDYCRGFILIQDFYDTNVGDALSKINLVELQQFIRIMTEGYGCRIKGLLMITASKFIEGFIKLIKPLFSEKVGNRIHAVTSRKSLPDLVQVNVLPEDYGGAEKSIKLLHEDLMESLSKEPIQKLLKEMNLAKTDESKRQIDQFNEDYMGMPGTFRTLSLD